MARPDVSSSACERGARPSASDVAGRRRRSLRPPDAPAGAGNDGVSPAAPGMVGAKFLPASIRSHVDQQAPDGALWHTFGLVFPRFPVRDAEVGSSNLPHPIGKKACSQALSVVFSPDAVAPRYSFHRAFIAPDGSHEPRALARSLRRHPTPRGRSLWSSAGRGTRRDVLRLARLAVLDHLPNADLTGHAPEVPVLDRRAWARPGRRAGRLVVGAGAKLS